MSLLLSAWVVAASPPWPVPAPLAPLSRAFYVGATWRRHGIFP